MSILEVRPDSGGQDAEDFAQTLVQSLGKFLTRNGHSTDLRPFSELARSYSIITDAPLTALKWLEGAHAVQRIPKGAAARHTSLVTVVARSEVEAQAICINPDDIRIDRYRGTGKGGQKKNKTSSAIRVVHKPTGIIITRESGRSQDANLASAMSQLEEELGKRSKKEAARNLSNQREVLQQGVKAFTHNYQRGEVVQHATNKKWSVKAWESGRASA